LLFAASLPALRPNVPPAIDQAGVSPTNPVIGQGFQIWAYLAGNLTGITGSVNVASIPGLSGSGTMVNNSGEWEYNVTSGATKNGTYYAFITITAPSGQQANQQVAVVIGSSTVTGGGSSSLTVTTGVSPQPFSISDATPGNRSFPWATVTYPGTNTGLTVYANFTAVLAIGGKGATAHYSKPSVGSTVTAALSGPSSVTLYGATPFVTYLNTTTTIYANVSVPGVGTAYGSATFGPNNFLIGYVYFTTATNNSADNTTTASHTCSSSSCPYLWLTVKDNWPTTEFSATPVTFTGYVNVTCAPSGGGSCTTSTAQSYKVSSTVSLVTGKTPVGLNAITNSTSGTTRWTPATNDGVKNYDFTATMALTLTSSSGTVTLGYIWDVGLLDFTT